MAPLASTRFESFTLEHLGLVVGFLVVAVVLALIGRAHRGTPGELRFRRCFAVVIPCVTVPFQVLQLLPQSQPPLMLPAPHAVGIPQPLRVRSRRAPPGGLPRRL